MPRRIFGLTGHANIRDYTSITCCGLATGADSTSTTQTVRTDDIVSVDMPQRATMRNLALRFASTHATSPTRYASSDDRLHGYLRPIASADH
mgnify:CR=1 FL=1